MPHQAVVAALASYRLSADLVAEVQLLWANGRVARAAALAVFALEADAKAGERIKEVTGIPELPRGEPHRRRIEASLASVSGMFAEDLEAIVGVEGLSTEAVWQVRQRALYVDRVDGDILTPDGLSVERAAAVVAAAQNVVNSRSVLGTDAELLTEFFVDYGDTWRRHIEPIAADARGESWSAAAAALHADISARWLFGEDGARVLQRIGM